ncbi:histone acetyltransferase 1 [Blastomyces parvus]|uniref:Histone acetyltransferase type B catalytic subunit n=1 Tax=Blastomyces parvus TaxID=2060905 RepID=A0A2B7WSU1_9EURO|nr:histone acetyltransferase 1 [Blastomyces parvus]
MENQSSLTTNLLTGSCVLSRYLGTCDANDVIQISMVQPAEGKLNALSTFRPEFTYPIFGEEETIFGYKGLSIRLRYAAHDLRSNVHISYDDKFKPVADVAAVDLLKILGSYLPKASFATSEEFEQSLLNDESAKDFRPPGKLVHRYTSKQRNYEIWAGSLIDPEIRTILDRIQIFVSFFVEGGTPITTDDVEWTLRRWTVYFVYEKIDPPTPNAPSYSFVGYATTYRWYFYLPEPSNTKNHEITDIPFPYAEEISIAQLPARLRIAQFLILQPHQQSGHGSQLYHTIHSACLADPTLHELTVEDPNEAFDYLRDTNDYKTLLPEFLKHKIRINADPYPPDNEISNNNSKDTGTKKARRPRRPRLMPTSSLIPTSTLHNLRIQYKLAPVQFAHIVEMYLLSQIPASHRGSGMHMGAGGTGAGSTHTARLLVQKWRAPNEHDRRYYWWRMLVKQRLYKRHRDLLIQLDRDERLGKLEETVGNVEEGYDGLLKAFEKRATREAEGENGGVGGGEGGPVRARGKRKFTVFGDEDEEDEDGDGDGGVEAGAEGAVKNSRDASPTKKTKI